MTKLSELETKMESVHIEQSDNDLFTFGETIKDYISIIQSAKVELLYLNLLTSVGTILYTGASNNSIVTIVHCLI